MISPIEVLQVTICISRAIIWQYTDWLLNATLRHGDVNVEPVKYIIPTLKTIFYLVTTFVKVLYENKPAIKYMDEKLSTTTNFKDPFQDMKALF